MNMTRFLFWNINRRPLASLIVGLATEYNPDFVLLAESQIPDDEILSALNNGQDGLFYPAPGITDRIKIYSRHPPQFITPVGDFFRFSVRHVHVPTEKDFVLVAVHLPSKLHQTDVELLLFCTRLASTIREQEELANHSRTLLVGDFNMNPFEDGLVAAEALHGVMDRRIAQKGSRKVRGETRRFFYNPMWSYLGDLSPGPPGTYYYDRGRQVNFFWNMFDQVLIRPDLIEAFDVESLRIVTHVGRTNLLDADGKPDRRVASDHLPLTFRIDLRKETGNEFKKPVGGPRKSRKD